MKDQASPAGGGAFLAGGATERPGHASHGNPGFDWPSLGVQSFTKQSKGDQVGSQLKSTSKKSAKVELLVKFPEASINLEAFSFFFYSADVGRLNFTIHPSVRMKPGPVA